MKLFKKKEKETVQPVKEVSPKNKYMEQVAEITGKEYKSVEKMMKKAKADFGVKYSEYIKLKLYDLSEEEQKAFFEEKKKAELAKEEEKARKAEARREKYINKVIAGTGWDREHAIEMMQSSLDRTGMSFEHYSAYRFWEVPEEEQGAYFTKAHADSLKIKYNVNKEESRTMINKVKFCTEFNEFLGRPWMATESMTLEAFTEKFASEEKIIYKPLKSTGGNGITVYDITDDNIQNVYDELRGKPEGIVEGFLKQHPEMQKLSLKSVNTIRVVTIRTLDPSKGIETDKVHFVYIGIRMGSGDRYVDNLHSGGLSAAVDAETGIVTTDAIDFMYNMHSVQPDTGVQIKGFQIPMFEEIKEMVEKAASRFEGYYGWDVAVTPTGPVLIEANTHPGAGVLQAPYMPEKKGMKYLIEKYL